MAVPAISAFCEREDSTDTIGLVPNSRLEEVAAPLLVQAHEQRAKTGQTVRLVAETTYQAGSWDRKRRVSMAKAKSPQVANESPHPAHAGYGSFISP